MPLDPEDIQSYKDQLVVDKQDYAEALVAVYIEDYLANAYAKDGEYARLAKGLSSDDLYKLSKMIEKAGDAKLALERTENRMRRNQIPF